MIKICLFFKRNLLKLAWRVAGDCRAFIINRVLKTKNTRSWVKVVPNPFLGISALTVLNPVFWIKLLFIKKDDCSVTLDFKIPEIPYRGHAYFDIKKAIGINKKIKRIGLIFFMGIGDYFYASKFIEALKQIYSDLLFDAYVSKNTDIHNSSLVGKCLEANPNFENIYYYNGKANTKNWKNYDYSDCYSKASADTLLIPIIYEYNVFIKSRFNSLCRTFFLKKEKTNLKPAVYINYPASQNVSDFFGAISSAFAEKNYKGIIFTQLTSRSSNYTYPFAKELIEKFINDNYFVITPENIDIKDSNCLKIDIKKTNINETVKLLALLKEEKYKLFCTCITSCFLAISSGLGIPMLNIQHIYDKGFKNIWFNNIFMAVNADYPQISANNLFIAEKKDYSLSNNIYTYNADFIFSCFNKMLCKMS